VVSAVGEAQGLTRYVQVRPEVDIRRLEEVLVLAGAPQGSAEPAPSQVPSGKPPAQPAEAAVHP
jgi:cell shape-determining protein MreC